MINIRNLTKLDKSTMRQGRQKVFFTFALNRSRKTNYGDRVMRKIVLLGIAMVIFLVAIFSTQYQARAN